MRAVIFERELALIERGFEPVDLSDENVGNSDPFNFQFAQKIIMLTVILKLAHNFRI